MAHFEKTVSEETVYSCRVFTVKKRSVLLENGNYANRDLVIHNGGATKTVFTAKFPQV